MNGEFVAPAYGHRSLCDVLPAVGTALGLGPGAGLAETQLALPAASTYVVFLIDGLGHRLLERHRDEAPYLHGLLGSAAPATAGVPSTTATSLTSMGTGVPAGIHGVVGYTSRIPGTERLLNALSWDKRVDPHEWQPHVTAFGRLAAAGVATTMVSKREFERSGLSVAFGRGAAYVGADRVGERIAAVAQAAASRPSFTYVYDGDLDWTGHRYGVDSPQWRAQLAAIDTGAEQLREALDEDTRLLVIADHGMVDSPPDRRLEIGEHPELRDGVHLLGGEARLRHLYCAGGAVADVIAGWRGTLEDRALVVSRDEAIESGWFGPVLPGVRPRLGDVIVAARGDFALLSKRDFPLELSLIGLHGSLTPDEMLIPLLIS